MLRCVCLVPSPGCPGTGSPAAGRCRRQRCCPPCVCLHAAELQHTPDNKSAATHTHTPQTVSQQPKRSSRTSSTATFVEVQLFLLLLFLLGLAVVGFGRHPLNLSGRLLPLAALVQGGLGSLADEVVRLCLGENGGALPLQEELPFRRQTREGRGVIISREWEGLAAASKQAFMAPG